MTDSTVAVSTDTLLGGRLQLRQPRKGHRAGTDAVLLAAACPTGCDLMVDVGAGVGTVGMALALRDPRLQGALLDDDPAILTLAEENCHLNGLAGRLRTVTADIFDPTARRAAVADGAADLVVTNPPFLSGRAHRPSPVPARARAHSLVGAGPADRCHAAWIKAAASLLAPGGRLVMIHRPEAVPEILSACDGRLGGLALRAVHGKPDGPAVRILLAGTKGSRAPLRLLPSLVLHEPDGRFTAAAEAIHRGDELVTM